MRTVRATLRALRQSLAALDPAGVADVGGRFVFGLAAVDDPLGGGLVRAGLHEVFAARTADTSTAAGFVAALALRAAPAERTVVWVRQAFAEAEAGVLHASGLMDLGFDPERLILVRVDSAAGVLRAGAEAVRCPALGAIVIESWGAPKMLDFTATRRLSLAAAQSGVTAFLLRLAAEPRPSAAATRWSVCAAPSRPLAANAPGHPAFDIALLRHRAGIAGLSWRVEWDNDRRIFRQAAPLPGAVVAIPSGRPAAPDNRRLARTA